METIIQNVLNNSNKCIDILSKNFISTQEIIEKNNHENKKICEGLLKESKNIIKDLTSITSFTIEEVLKIYENFEIIFNNIYVLNTIVFNPIVLKIVNSGKSETSIKEVQRVVDIVSNYIDNWYNINEYKNVAKLMVEKNNTNDQKNNYAFKQTVLKSKYNELSINIIMLINDQFNNDEKIQLNELFFKWKNEILGIVDSSNTSNEIITDKLVIGTNINYASRHNLVPYKQICSFKEIKNIIDDGKIHNNDGELSNQKFNNSSVNNSIKGSGAKTSIEIFDELLNLNVNFILFLNIPIRSGAKIDSKSPNVGSITLYDILPLVSKKYVDENKLNTTMDSPLVDKIIDRFSTIKNFNKSTFIVDKTLNDYNKRLVYYVNDIKMPFYVFEFQGYQEDIPLTTILSLNISKPYIPAHTAINIIKVNSYFDITEQSEKYSEILEEQIIKHNDLEHIKNIRDNFVPEMTLSIDIITDKICNELTVELKKLKIKKEGKTMTQFEFLNLLPDIKSLDYIVISALNYTKNIGDNYGEINISYIAALNDIIYYFKKEFKNKLFGLGITNNVLMDISAGEFESFVIDSYCKAIKYTVETLNKEQEMWSNIVKSIKTAII